MAQENEYVQKLIAARDREVTHRRELVGALAEKQNRGDTENMREAFIKIQEVIEAIERAWAVPAPSPPPANSNVAVARPAIPRSVRVEFMLRFSFFNPASGPAAVFLLTQICRGPRCYRSQHLAQLALNHICG